VAINRRDDGTFIISKPGLVTRLGKLLNIVPNPDLGLLDGILGTIDVTPAKPGLQALDPVVVNALGTFSAAAMAAGSFASARVVGGPGAGINQDLITNIPKDAVFILAGKLSQDGLGAAATMSAFFSIQDQAGARNYVQWAAVVNNTNGLGAFEFRSPLLRAPEVLKLSGFLTGVALNSTEATYSIEVYELIGS